MLGAGDFEIGGCNPNASHLIGLERIVTTASGGGVWVDSIPRGGKTFEMDTVSATRGKAVYGDPAPGQEAAVDRWLGRQKERFRLCYEGSGMPGANRFTGERLYAYRLDLATDGICTSRQEEVLDPLVREGEPLTTDEIAMLIDMGIGPHSICRLANTTGGSGNYLITNKLSILKEIIRRLKDPNFSDPRLTSQERKAAIIRALEGLPTVVTDRRADQAERERTDAAGDRRQMKYTQWLTVLIFLAIGRDAIKNLIKEIRGAVKTTDFGQVMKAVIAKFPDFEVIGRQAEAVIAWELTNDEEYRSIMINLESGEGKDELVKQMVAMKIRRHQSIPAKFLDAPIYKINAAEFQSDTKYRGTVADKVAEIAARARKSPVIYYMSEIDLIFLSGATTESDTESPGKLLLDLLEDPVIRENLIIIGTTSRGREMLDRYPDLQRRFHWPKLHKYSLSEMFQIISTGYTKAKIEAKYGVTLEQGVIDVAMRLAETYVRPLTQRTEGRPTPRFDCVKEILKAAARMAQKAGQTQVSVETVIKAVEEIYSLTVDRTDLDKFRAEPLDRLATVANKAAQDTEAQVDRRAAVISRLVRQMENMSEFVDVALDSEELQRRAEAIYERWKTIDVRQRAVLIRDAAVGEVFDRRVDYLPPSLLMALDTQSPPLTPASGRGSGRGGRGPAGAAPAHGGAPGTPPTAPGGGASARAGHQATVPSVEDIVRAFREDDNLREFRGLPDAVLSARAEVLYKVLASMPDAVRASLASRIGPRTVGGLPIDVVRSIARREGMPFEPRGRKGTVNPAKPAGRGHDVAREFERGPAGPFMPRHR